VADAVAVSLETGALTAHSLVTNGPGEPDRADRFFHRTTIRPRNACYSQACIHPGRNEGTLRHLLCHDFTDCSVLPQGSRFDMQHVYFCTVTVANEAAIKPGRAASEVSAILGHPTPSAGLSSGHQPSLCRQCPRQVPQGVFNFLLNHSSPQLTAYHRPCLLTGRGIVR